MAFDWIAILSGSLTKTLIERLYHSITNRFSHSLHLEACILNHRVVTTDGAVLEPDIFVSIVVRNRGKTAEFIHRYGFDGSIEKNKISTLVEYSSPFKLDPRSLTEFKIKFRPDHDPILTSIWVESSLEERRQISKHRLTALTYELGDIVARNKKMAAVLDSQRSNN